MASCTLEDSLRALLKRNAWGYTGVDGSAIKLFFWSLSVFIGPHSVNSNCDLISVPARHTRYVMLDILS